MARLSPILRSVKSTEGQFLAFWCPGCDSTHVIRVRDDQGQRPSWTYNGNPEAPTFQPSILVTSGRRVKPDYVPQEDDPPECCHSFVTDGKIMFLDDCTHELAGKTVPLPVWDKEWGGTED